METGKGGNRDVVDIRGAKRSGGSSGGGVSAAGRWDADPRWGRQAGRRRRVVVVIVVVLIKSSAAPAAAASTSRSLRPAGDRTGRQNPAPIPRSEDPDADLKDFSVYVFEDVQNTWQ